MEDIEILKTISKYNLWWIGNEIPKSQLLEFKRRFFYTLANEMGNNKIAFE